MYSCSLLSSIGTYGLDLFKMCCFYSPLPGPNIKYCILRSWAVVGQWECLELKSGWAKTLRSRNTWFSSVPMVFLQWHVKFSWLCQSFKFGNMNIEYGTDNYFKQVFVNLVKMKRHFSFLPGWYHYFLWTEEPWCCVLVMTRNKFLSSIFLSTRRHYYSVCVLRCSVNT